MGVLVTLAIFFFLSPFVAGGTPGVPSHRGCVWPDAKNQPMNSIRLTKEHSIDQIGIPLKWTLYNESIGKFVVNIGQIRLNSINDDLALGNTIKSGGLWGCRGEL